MSHTSSHPSQSATLTQGKVIVIAQSKGGSGKSMTAVNIAIDSANQGRNVLLVDLEKDGTTSDYESRDNLTVISGYDKSFPSMINVYRKSFDLIVIDTAGVNADMNADSRDNLQELLNKKAMCQSDLILIPVVPAPVDVRKSMRFISSVEDYIDASMGLRKGLIFLNKTVSTEIHTKEAKKVLSGEFSIPLSKHSIRRAVAFEHAEGEFQSINEFAPNSAAAHDMRLLQKNVFELLAD